MVQSLKVSVPPGDRGLTANAGTDSVARVALDEEKFIDLRVRTNYPTSLTYTFQYFKRYKTWLCDPRQGRRTRIEGSMLPLRQMAALVLVWKSKSRDIALQPTSPC